ncbi:fibrinogen-like YCDxxxxGGGW domain-containing protein [Schaalia sp. Marseille-Q2122]|uniref:fibrinogen-like YCDxxxxGGGW domain-containing protein n=1 Tax=Schaalia sp. Marseille-Q2122 TaxID=2736604 RepID=UPI00158A794A|nr:fibrinogen-like YCDxxxxGGGW domain-containing protein [Schaalia sp. Marseille-Q2122]
MKLRSFAGVAAVAALAFSTLVMLSPAGTAIGTRDGKTADTAAASCWEIKQQNPAADSGTYWIVTPSMPEPMQVFCDQRMDGGGWALVGRGREGWDLYPQGKGNQSALTSRDRGPGAFDTVQMPGEVIDGLINRTPVNSLDEGFRVLRATSPHGRSFQAIDIRPGHMLRWQWAFGSAETLSYRFDGGQWYFGGSFQKRFGLDSGYRNLDMSQGSNRSYRVGYAFGPQVHGGSTSPSNYWWQSNSHVLPYSEVYVRPRIISSDSGFTRIPDEGTPAVVRPFVASDMATPTRWGVVGNLNGKTREGNSPVQAFVKIGNTMYVGGNFTGVQAGRNGAFQSRTALAAFNATTGEWISDFGATFNDQVKALVAMPDGNLLVGGDFTTVNGQRHSGTVLLDSRTGNPISTWDLQIDNRLRRGVVSVRSIVRSGDHIYFGGTFTHLNGRGVKNVYARAAGRVDLNGRPDRSWNPEFNGGVMDIDASSAEGRVYAAGFFSRSANRYEVNKAAVVSDKAGAEIIPFAFRGSYGHNDFQQAVAHTGTLVFFGGSQHSIYGFLPETMQRVSSSITSHSGGDFQAFATDGQVIYGGCHCFGWSYEDAVTWPGLGPGWTQAYKVQGVGAWSATDGSQIPWVPFRLASKNAGAWSLYVADDGALWVGGDFTGSHTSMDRHQWNGGFVRYPAGDTTPPNTPQPLWASSYDKDTVTLQWGRSQGAARYQILRDDRPIASTTNTTLVIPRGGDDRYFVRAVDEAGNISASSAVYTAPQVNEETPELPKPEILIEEASEWKYYNLPQAPDAQWREVDFDDSTWGRGKAPLGYGSPGLGTTLNSGQGAQRPITTYFRHEFTVDDPTTISALVLTYVADDGAAVYLNGKEVSRERLSEGRIDHNTRANRSIGATAALNDPTEVRLTPEEIREGKNVLSVETHLNYRSSRTLTFQARLMSEPLTPRAAMLTPAEDMEELEGDDAAAEELVVADCDGQNIRLIEPQSTWRYLFSPAAPVEGWETDADLSPWQTAKAPLGWGSKAIATELDPAAHPVPVHLLAVRDITLGEITDNTRLVLNVQADDAVVVRVNGVEVARQGLPEGDLTLMTPAITGRSSADAQGKPLVVEVPSALPGVDAPVLRQGMNRIAVEIHRAIPDDGDMLFETIAEVRQ